MDIEKLNAQFKQFNIIFIALGVGQLFTLLTFYFVIYQNGAGAPDMDSIFNMLVPIVAASSCGAGYVLYNQMGKTAKLDTALDVETRFSKYRTASLILYATAEGGSLFALIAFFLTGNQMYLAVFALSFLWFIYNKPSIEKFNKDFNA